MQTFDLVGLDILKAIEDAAVELKEERSLSGNSPPLESACAAPPPPSEVLLREMTDDLWAVSKRCTALASMLS